MRLAENGSKYVEIIFDLDNYIGNPAGIEKSIAVAGYKLIL